MTGLGLISSPRTRRRSRLRPYLCLTTLLATAGALAVARSGKAGTPGNNKPASAPTLSFFDREDLKTAKLLVDAAGALADAERGEDGGGRASNVLRSNSGTLDPAEWGTGKHYSELLRQSGTATSVAAAARAVLKNNAQDCAARLRLAYALRARGDEAGMRRELKQIPVLVLPAIRAAAEPAKRAAPLRSELQDAGGTRK